MSFYHLPVENRFQGSMHRISRQVALRPRLNDVFPLDVHPSHRLPSQAPKPMRELSPPVPSQRHEPGEPLRFRDPYLAHPGARDRGVSREVRGQDVGNRRTRQTDPGRISRPREPESGKPRGPLETIREETAPRLDNRQKDRPARGKEREISHVIPSISETKVHEPTFHEYKSAILTPRIREYDPKALSYRQPVDYQGNVDYKLSDTNLFGGTVGKNPKEPAHHAGNPPRGKISKPQKPPNGRAVQFRNDPKQQPLPSKVPHVQRVPEERQPPQDRRPPTEEVRIRPDANLPDDRYQSTDLFQVQGAWGASGFVPPVDLDADDRGKDGQTTLDREESLDGIAGMGGPDTPDPEDLSPGRRHGEETERRLMWNTTIGSLLDDKPYGRQFKGSEVAGRSKKVKIVDPGRTQAGADNSSPRRHGNLPISLRPGASPFLGYDSPRASGRDSNPKMAALPPASPNAAEQPPTEPPQPAVAPFWEGAATPRSDKREATPVAEPGEADQEEKINPGERSASKIKQAASRAEVTLKPDGHWDWTSVLDLEERNENKPEVTMFGPSPHSLRMGVRRKARHPYDDLVRDGSAQPDLDGRRKVKVKPYPKTQMGTSNVRRRDKWLESTGHLVPLPRAPPNLLLQELREDRRLYLTARTELNKRQRNPQPFGKPKAGEVTNRRSIRFADDDIVIPRKVDVESLIDPVPKPLDRPSRLELIRGHNFLPDPRGVSLRRATSLPDETTRRRAADVMQKF